MTACLQFWVAGHPRTKGSLRPFHRRGPVDCTIGFREEAGFPLSQWRTFVAHAAKRAIGADLPLQGPLQVGLRFYFPRPIAHGAEAKAIPWAWGNKKWDIDKLTRAVLDALTDAAIWEDDSQVAVLLASKQHMTPETPAGCMITVGRL